MSASNHWVLPGLKSLLSGPEGSDWRRWLGRAERLEDSEFGARQAFADALGVELAQLPWAQACAIAELGAKRAEQVLAIADPVQTRLEIYSLRLMGVGVGSLDPATVSELIVAINQWIAADGLTVVVGDQHWYLCGERTAWSDPGCQPPDSLLGASLADALPQARPWQRLLNDIQMFLNQHPSLQDRRNAGAKVIDSLWFWGGAPEPSTSAEVAWVDAVEPDFIALAVLLGLDSKQAKAAPGVIEGPGTNATAIAPSLRNGPLRLNFSSGERFALRPSDRYRFWSAPFADKHKL